MGDGKGAVKRCPHYGFFGLLRALCLTGRAIKGN